MTDTARRVLVIGGNGVFGSRLVTLLRETTAFHIIIASRHGGALQHDHRMSAVTLDAAAVTAEQLRATGAFAIVDAAGPFQGADHHLARTAIAAGLHIIDLADARDYVAGFHSLDAAAKQAGIVALTGASSTPALSNAALDHLTRGWHRLDQVEIAISPGNRAPRGLSVIRAILSYAGAPITVFLDGAWQQRPGWGLLVWRSMPGIGKRLLSLSETPDLDIVPARFHVTGSAIFRAGLELPVLHLGLWAASLLRRAHLLPSLAPFARPVRAIATLFAPFGTDRGGMTVDVTGLDPSGQPTRARWWLIAEAGDGPFVPILPALAALRALAEQRLAAEPGAHICAGILPPEMIEAEFGALNIRSGAEAHHAPPSLFQTVLGDTFASMPPAVRELHQPGYGMRAAGYATVEGATTNLAKLIAALFRFPRAARHIPVTVAITPNGQTERWMRDFGGNKFTSMLSPAPQPRCIVERFGLLAFTLELAAGYDGIDGMMLREWHAAGIRMPLWLAPISIARETTGGDGRFRFDVDINLPLKLGRIVRYRGTLAPH